MTKCQNLSDRQQGAEFEKFVTHEWTYATSVVSRVTSPEQALKTLGVGSGGGGGCGGGNGGGNAQKSGTGGADGKFNYWRDRRANKNGGGGPNQVPVGPAQPNGGGSSQAAQKTAVTAAGAASGGGNANQAANHQNVQKNQQNGQKQNYANFNRNNGGGGGSGANNEKEYPSACKVEHCARKEKHYLDRCDIFPTLSMVKRWAFIRENNLCTYCLKHSSKLVCHKAVNEQGPAPCGIKGCVEVHHPWLHCWSSVKGHVGLRVITKDPKKPHKEPLSEKAVELKSVVAGARAVNVLELEPAGNDSDAGDQFNFDADSESESDVEMSAEPVEPQVEPEERQWSLKSWSRSSVLWRAPVTAALMVTRTVLQLLVPVLIVTQETSPIILSIISIQMKKRLIPRMITEKFPSSSKLST
jgi:hypothetical protein